MLKLFHSLKKGYIYGIIVCILSQITFGVNGFGASHLRSLGLNTHSILIHRFLLASIILFAILKALKEPIKTPKRDLITGALGGLFFWASALSLYTAFEKIDSGLACTILFLYPVITLVIMAIFYHERVAKIVVACAVIAFIGIAIISGTPDKVTPEGLLYALLSALSYSAYLVLYEHRKPKISAFKNAFITSLVAGLVMLLHALFISKPIIPAATIPAIGYTIFVALVPTVISIYLTVESLKYLGPTLTGIFGAMEPLTAVVLGILFLGETFTPRLILGASLVLFSMTLLAFKNKRD